MKKKYTLSERDRALVWHPLTQEKTAAWPMAIQRGEGSYVYDEQGKAYLDLISSWWVNLHGHAQPLIAQAIYEQAMQLEHVIFAGFTHAPAVTLCENLQEKLPASLSRFFYSDNGSTAVEVALKMAYQYWHNQNQKRTLFLNLEGGYHGDTFGAMAVGAKSGFHDKFKDLLFQVESIPYPATWEGDEEVAFKEAQALAALEGYLLEQGEKVAAIILEPLIQGASGMRVCRAVFVEEVVKRVRQYGILVIFDEVMTGFSRTGTLFALEQVGVVPDFLCVSKGITGGFLPLALTITTTSVYEAFLDNTWEKAFLHSHSYTANPLACAASIASLALLLQDSTQQAIQAIEEAHCVGIAMMQTMTDRFHRSRVLGTISAFELSTSEEAKICQQQCLEKGLLLRPIGRTLYLLPPYSTSYEEVMGAYTTILA